MLQAVVRQRQKDNSDAPGLQGAKQLLVKHQTEQALVAAFLAAEEDICCTPGIETVGSGTTATLALVQASSQSMHIVMHVRCRAQSTHAKPGKSSISGSKRGHLLHPWHRDRRLWHHCNACLFVQAGPLHHMLMLRETKSVLLAAEGGTVSRVKQLADCAGLMLLRTLHRTSPDLAIGKGPAGRPALKTELLAAVKIM